MAMRLHLRLVAALSTMAVLLIACGGGDPPATDLALSPSSSPSTGPVTIPPEVRLPHEGVWRRSSQRDTQPLPSVCVDPGPDLYPPDTTDHRGAYVVGSGWGRSESLGVYRDRRRSRRAITVWRQQLARCAGPGSFNHVGEPYEWFVDAVAIRGGDEAWQAHELSAVEDDGVTRTISFVTVVRVGNAVYVRSDRRVALSHDDDTIAATSTAEISSIAAFVPMLSAFSS